MANENFSKDIREILKQVGGFQGLMKVFGQLAKDKKLKQEVQDKFKEIAKRYTDVINDYAKLQSELLELADNELRDDPDFVKAVKEVVDKYKEVNEMVKETNNISKDLLEAFQRLLLAWILLFVVTREIHPKKIIQKLREMQPTLKDKLLVALALYQITKASLKLVNVGVQTGKLAIDKLRKK